MAIVWREEKPKSAKRDKLAGQSRSRGGVSGIDYGALSIAQLQRAPGRNAAKSSLL
jgi:hypothetical protein